MNYDKTAKRRPLWEELWEEYCKQLRWVNDESADVTCEEHRRRKAIFNAWVKGAEFASGEFLNGDYYYIYEDSIDRPMCCGVFLDWTQGGKDAALEALEGRNDG